jgi:hypothetical protein
LGLPFWNDIRERKKERKIEGRRGRDSRYPALKKKLSVTGIKAQGIRGRAFCPAMLVYQSISSVLASVVCIGAASG